MMLMVGAEITETFAIGRSVFRLSIMFKSKPLPLVLSHNRHERPPIHEPKVTLLPRPNSLRPRTAIQQCDLPKSHPGMERALDLCTLVHGYAPYAEHVEPIALSALPDHHTIPCTPFRAEKASMRSTSSLLLHARKSTL